MCFRVLHQYRIIVGATYTAALRCSDVPKAPWAPCTLYLACSFAGPSLLVHSVCGRLNRGLDELYTFCF